MGMWEGWAAADSWRLWSGDAYVCTAEMRTACVTPPQGHYWLVGTTRQEDLQTGLLTLAC